MMVYSNWQVLLSKKTSDREHGTPRRWVCRERHGRKRAGLERHRRENNTV